LELCAPGTMAPMRLLLVAQTTVLVVGIENSEFVNAMTQDSRPCVKNNVCLANGGRCCSGHKHHTLRCGTRVCEWACEKAVGKVIKELATKGCAEIIFEGIGLCYAASLGPEDPLGDVCAAVVATGCYPIAHAVANHITDRKQICESLPVCKNSGYRCDDGHSHADVLNGVVHNDTEDHEDVLVEDVDDFDEEDQDNSCFKDGACLSQFDGTNFGTCCSGLSHETTMCGTQGVRCGAAHMNDVVV